MGYDESVSSIIEKHKWSIICLHLEDIFEKVVHEFYAHVNSPDSPTSILFDEDHSNT
ncbi:hypothetical protein J1N35_013865 [Gossypium stocksii]|uniref:Uncharacterized protein n=1 Tax=Gossypium stocksii TaxID=47602 RepID=A0A9D3VVX2_9ROSI|nr:hypothetical protein J1N35_013865 [Gossypium stocksii]